MVVEAVRDDARGESDVDWLLGRVREGQVMFAYACIGGGWRLRTLRHGLIDAPTLTEAIAKAKVTDVRAKEG